MHIDPIHRNKRRKLAALQLTTLPSKQNINRFFFLYNMQPYVIFLLCSNSPLPSKCQLLTSRLQQLNPLVLNSKLQLLAGNLLLACLNALVLCQIIMFPVTGRACNLHLSTYLNQFSLLL